MSQNIAITDTYLQSVFKLDDKYKKLTLNTIKQLAANPRSSGLQIHSIDRQKCDPKFRSARVNDDLRVIFVMQENVYTLLYVDHHDASYDWCEGKYLAKTDFGAPYIYDERVMLMGNSSPYEDDYLLAVYNEPLLKKADIKEKQLIKLGVAQIHANNLLKMSSEDSFIEYITIFPSEIQEALLDLAAGTKTFETVYNELIDSDYDKDKPLTQKDSKRRFYTTQSMEELQMLMENESFEKWMIFLHPSQEKLVKMNYKGPVLIEGGPGTGKTIVGIHRAVYLAENVYKANENKKILFCTFSKKLAKVIEKKIDVLMKQRGVANNVDVFHVDGFIKNMLIGAYGSTFSINVKAFNNMLGRLYETLCPKGSRAFYEYEYHEIIERYRIKNLDEYLNADRSGSGIPLDKKQRTTAWSFLEALLNEKEKNDIRTLVDRAYALFDGVENGIIIPQYDSIIIDEAQDLEPIKLKALCRSVRTESNNVMILSDTNQRIFRLGTWKNDTGINVVGRTYYLSVNYRTTKQINDYARYQFINSEMSTAHIKEYKSIVNGNEPTVLGFKTAREQRKFLMTKVNELTTIGYAPNQICIVCPTREDCYQVQSAIEGADVDTVLLLDDTTPFDDIGICICPIAGVKGLEFEVVIIYNYTNIGLNRVSETDSSAIKVNFEKMIECEKYVAATRAREELFITYVEVNE